MKRLLPCYCLVQQAALCRGSGCTECSCVNHSCLSSRKLQATGAVIATERHFAACWICRDSAGKGTELPTSLWWPLRGFALWKGKVGGLHYCSSKLCSGSVQEPERLPEVLKREGSPDKARPQDHPLATVHIMPCVWRGRKQPVLAPQLSFSFLRW